MEPLDQQVAARADRLATESVRTLYQDPFWEARYGWERSRRFGDEDARFHVRYLVEALASRRSSVLEDYARWLRTLLVSRGMCTLHLDQNFAGLQRALQAEGWGPGTEPHDYLHRARVALRYPDGPEHQLEEDAPRLARDAASRLLHQVAPTNTSRMEEELRLHLSYLADALAANRPERMKDHVHWYSGFWPRRDFGPLAFPTVLSMLKTVLESRHSEAGVLLATTMGVSKEETHS